MAAVAEEAATAEGTPETARHRARRPWATERRIAKRSLTAEPNAGGAHLGQGPQHQEPRLIDGWNTRAPPHLSRTTEGVLRWPDRLEDLNSGTLDAVGRPDQARIAPREVKDRATLKATHRLSKRSRTAARSTMESMRPAAWSALLSGMLPVAVIRSVPTARAAPAIAHGRAEGRRWQWRRLRTVGHQEAEHEDRVHDRDAHLLSGVYEGAVVGAREAGHHSRRPRVVGAGLEASQHRGDEEDGALPGAHGEDVDVLGELLRARHAVTPPPDGWMIHSRMKTKTCACV